MDFVSKLNREIVCNPAELRKAIGDFMREHTVLSYAKAREVLYKHTHSVNLYGENIPVYYSSSLDAYAAGFNAEHIVPQSFFGKKPPMVSDMHHLYPASGKLNRMRSNYKFAELDAPVQVGDVEVDTKHTSFEPSCVSKGNVARAIAYFATVYPAEVEITRVIDLATLIVWDHLDPVDESEIGRNHTIREFQGNSNLFIEHPDLLIIAFIDAFATDSITMVVDGEAITITKAGAEQRRDRFCRRLEKAKESLMHKAIDAKAALELAAKAVAEAQIAIGEAIKALDY